jgi:hypothetical protein
MDFAEFEGLTDQARVWIFGLERPLNDGETQRLEEGLAQFAAGWDSHKVPVKAAFKIALNRFVIIAAESTDGVSGCSIDSMVRNLKTLQDSMGLGAPRGNLIFFADEEGKVQSTDHLSFYDTVDSGRIKPETKVFDTLVQNLGQLRAGGFEPSFETSWHSKTFPLTVSS